MVTGRMYETGSDLYVCILMQGNLYIQCHICLCIVTGRVHHRFRSVHTNNYMQGSINIPYNAYRYNITTEATGQT